MNKIILPISGLHCEACEFISEDTISRHASEVKRVKISRHKGTAEIWYEGNSPDINKINKTLQPLGYTLGQEESSKPKTLSTILAAIGLAVLAGLVGSSYFFDVSSFLPQQQFGLASSVLVGLVAGFSTCMALVGGLVLSISSAWSAKHPEADTISRSIPQLFFNAGRLAGFFVFGGLLGVIGKSITPSPLANGAINILVGVIIIAVGLSLVSPRFKSLFSLPKFLAKKISAKQEKEYSGFRTMILGAMTFFLPCGFTQAMQLYAVSSGSFIEGALAMSLFAIGTIPGLLGIGMLGGQAGIDKKKFLFKAVSIVIIAFGMINAISGAKLVKAGTAAKQGSVSGQEAACKVEPLEIVMTQLGTGYSPNYLIVELGRPVRWIIDSKTQYSCASSFVVPSLGIRRQLKLGKNIIEFTPTKLGKIPFSCSMGMYTGTIEVIEKSAPSQDACLLNGGNADRQCE